MATIVLSVALVWSLSQWVNAVILYCLHNYFVSSRAFEKKWIIRHHLSISFEFLLDIYLDYCKDFWYYRILQDIYYWSTMVCKINGNITVVQLFYQGNHRWSELLDLYRIEDVDSSRKRPVTRKVFLCLCHHSLKWIHVVMWRPIQNPHQFYVG